MSGLIFHERPTFEKTTLIAAVAGWPDAQHGASGVMRYLVRHLSAQKFAEVDPEEFFVFTRQRPQVRVTPEGGRTIRWPANNFYYHRQEDPLPDLVLFLGTEPQMKWRAFTAAVMEVAKQCNTERAILLGSLLDAVPHTRDPKFSGSSTSPQLGAVLEEMAVRPSKYEGPTGITSAMMEAFGKESLEYASLWVHAPHYLQASPNPKVRHAMLKRLMTIVPIGIDLRELAEAAGSFDGQVTKAVADHQEMAGYIKRLEEQYDEAADDHPQAPQLELPSSDVVIQDLEDFLREQRPRSTDDEEGGQDAGPSMGSPGA